jgi:hypothetical protein
MSKFKANKNPIISLLFLIIIPFGVAALTYYHGRSVALETGISFVLMLIPLFISLTRESPLMYRSKLLYKSVKESGSDILIDKVGKQYFINQEEAKQEQIKNAKNDKTPFIEIGKSTALFAQRRDNFSPTEPNLKLGLSVKDLSPHLFTLGASGTGKTYGIIRPIAKKWVDLDQGGMIVIDGKGVLPLEIQAYCDSDKYQLITPSQNKFNPLLGMSADSFADTLSSVCSSSNESDPFWSDSARLLLRMAGNALNTLHTPLSFNQIYSFIMLSVEEKERLFSSIYSEKPLVKNMMSYFLDELPNMPDKTRDGIINMVRTWLGNIINNKDLSDWVETDSNDVMIEDVFLGKKIGLLVPETQYGKGGAIISAIIMRKIYDTAKKRGDAWVKDPMQTPVLMVADEIQNILSTADIENVAIARSLGLYLLMASQNIDGLYKRLGKDGTVQMLGNFASIVALPPKTNDSNDYLALRSGSVWKAVVTGYHGIPDSQADFNLFGNKSDETLQSFDLYRRVNIKRPRLVYSLGLLNGKSTIQTLPSLSFDVQPLVSSSEIDNLLSKPYTAIAILNRGGVARRDVIDLGA